MSDSPHPAAARIRDHVALVRIPFRPVPVKARHDGWTPERQRAFIDRLCVTGHVGISAQAVGMTAQTAYRLRDRKGAASFRRAWDEALGAGKSHVLDVGITRAIEGERVPVYYRGRRVGERIRHDNSLLIAALKATECREEERSRAQDLARFHYFLDLIGRDDAAIEK
jgi:hypothetical protein